MQDEFDDTHTTAESPEHAGPGVDGAVRRERQLNSTPEEAWELLRDSEGLSQWLADEVELEVVPGGEGITRDGDGLERTVVVEAVEEQRRLALRWWTPDGEPTVVDISLTEHEDGTRFVVTEVPVRAFSVPDVAPSSWTIDGGSGGATAPQAMALACH
jgi:uncharacterized protein YndB with AHSA1/START domain